MSERLSRMPARASSVSRTCAPWRATATTCSGETGPGPGRAGICTSRGCMALFHAPHPGAATARASRPGGASLYPRGARPPAPPPLVTDVGVRLPAQLTASGLAMLAALPAAQVRALFPSRESFVQRHGVGPESPSALRQQLVE